MVGCWGALSGEHGWPEPRWTVTVSSHGGSGGAGAPSQAPPAAPPSADILDPPRTLVVSHEADGSWFAPPSGWRWPVEGAAAPRMEGAACLEPAHALQHALGLGQRPAAARARAEEADGEQRVTVSPASVLENSTVTCSESQSGNRAGLLQVCPALEGLDCSRQFPSAFTCRRSLQRCLRWSEALPLQFSSASPPGA